MLLNLIDLVVLRAAYNEELRDIVLSEDQERLAEWLKRYNKQDRMMYDFSQTVDIKEAKKELIEELKEMNYAYEKGIKYNGL